MEVKKFWENPENNPLKITLLIVIIATAGFFIFQNAQKNSLKNAGLVLHHQ
jgi:predicted negative regulator of RcsB-dependent stress response